jgi:hypothetical protein
MLSLSLYMDVCGFYLLENFKQKFVDVNQTIYRPQISGSTMWIIESFNYCHNILHNWDIYLNTAGYLLQQLL